MTKKGFIILILSIAVSIHGLGQAEKSRWTNKDKGTYIVSPHYLGIVTDTANCAVSIKIYELSANGCKRITTGSVYINSKEYMFYDRTDTPDSNDFKDPTNFFYTDLPEGEYTLRISVNKNYYSVKTDRFFLKAKNIYQFSFYVIRKDSIKKE